VPLYDWERYDVIQVNQSFPSDIYDRLTAAFASPDDLLENAALLFQMVFLPQDQVDLAAEDDAGDAPLSDECSTPDVDGR
jgi:hypothetical protein